MPRAKRPLAEMDPNVEDEGVAAKRREAIEEYEEHEKSKEVRQLYVHFHDMREC